MPEQKLKSENYAAVGGVNRKTSHYITDKNSFLTLENVDFRTLGALSSTYGTTQVVLAPTNSEVTGISDYAARNITYGFGGISYSIIATDQNSAYNITGQTFLSIYSFIFPNNPTPFSFSKNTYLFGTNSWDFFTYPGSTTAWQYGLPAPYWNTFPFTGSGATGGLSGLITIYAAFQRSDGLLGPYASRTIDTTSSPGHGVSQIVFGLPTLNPAIGVSFGSFGVSGIQIWYQINSQEIIGYVDLVSPTATSYIITSPAQPFTSTSVTQPEDYFGTFLYGFNSDNGASTVNPVSSYNPSTIAIFNNQLFAGGFFYAPDTVWFSQIGNFEKHDNTAFFDVRESDGDIISALVSYFSQLICFKINSISALAGTDASNFYLTEISSVYGCLSSRAFCVWEQNLFFLDTKGIGSYNGANTKIISENMEDYFLRMNVQAARSEAIMVHVKEQNEVWTAIPIDGATHNNIVIIFDYLANAWRTRTITQGTALTTITQGISKQKLLYGDYSGMIYQYGKSLFTDNGTAFTSIIKSRFVADLGHSVEKQFRRLFLDAVIPSGQTYTFPVNFYSDEGVTPYQQMTMVLSQFQNRVDFGVPAKDFSIEIFYSQGQFLQINGFTIEYRFQRAV